jgi:multicomponent Na+:H+ antiporter subunit E
MTPSVRLPALVMWLTLVWALLWADFGVANLLAGLAVAMIVVLVARPTGVRGIQLTSFHPVSALVFLGYFVFQLVKSNLLVAWEIVTPGSGINRAIIAVPMHVDSNGLVTLVGNAVTLTPGTLTIDLKEADPVAGTPPVLYVHVLHFDDVATVRSGILRLERLAVKAFGSKQQLAQLETAVRERAAS